MNLQVGSASTAPPADGSRGNGLQGLSVKYEEPCPCFLGLQLVIDRRVRRAPPVRCIFVDFDFCGPIRFCQGFLQSGLVIGRLRVVIGSYRNEELGLAPCRLEVGAVWLISDQPATVESG